MGTAIGVALAGTVLGGLAADIGHAIVLSTFHYFSSRVTGIYEAHKTHKLQVQHNTVLAGSTEAGTLPTQWVAVSQSAHF